MAKATALARARRVKQRPKPKPQSAQIGPDGPKHPDNRQLYNKRGCPDAGARLHADYPKPKVATFCDALWLTFTLPLTHFRLPDSRIDEPDWSLRQPWQLWRQVELVAANEHLLAALRDAWRTHDAAWFERKSVWIKTIDALLQDHDVKAEV